MKIIFSPDEMVEELQYCGLGSKTARIRTSQGKNSREMAVVTLAFVEASGGCGTNLLTWKILRWKYSFCLEFELFPNANLKFYMQPSNRTFRNAILLWLFALGAG